MLSLAPYLKCVIPIGEDTQSDSEKKNYEKLVNEIFFKREPLWSHKTEGQTAQQQFIIISKKGGKPSFATKNNLTENSLRGFEFPLVIIVMPENLEEDITLSRCTSQLVVLLEEDFVRQKELHKEDCVTVIT